MQRVNVQRLAVVTVEWTSGCNRRLFNVLTTLSKAGDAERAEKELAKLRAEGSLIGNPSFGELYAKIHDITGTVSAHMKFIHISEFEVDVDVINLLAPSRDG